MPAAERWSSLFSCTFVLLTPLVIFLRHHDYGLLRPESLLASGLVALIGLALGVLATTLPSLARLFVIAGALVMFVDLQLDWIDSAGGALVVLFVATAGLWMIRDRAGRVTSFMFAIMLVSTLPLAPGDGSVRKSSLHGSQRGSAKQPPVLHLVLDEQIAVGGIPTEFDPDGAVRRVVEETYVTLGFRVFSRAFSRHFTTPPSLSHLVNMSDGDRSHEFYDNQEKRVTKNRYFEVMSKRGYRIHVLQTDYIDFCKDDDAVDLASCSTYTLESPKAFESIEIDTFQKARAITGMFFQLSTLLKHWRQSYKALVKSAESRGVDLPPWPFRAGRMSTVSSMELLPILEGEIENLEPGDLYFAHLLLPHFPYAFDRSCGLRPNPVTWLTYKSPALRPTRNSPETRAERYAHYLEQVECTTRRLGELLGRVLARENMRDAMVIIHGDHGSRINLTTPNQPNMHRMTPADFADAFSTHFAIRSPKVVPGRDRREVAIDELLREVITNGAIPGGSSWIRSRDVFITGKAGAPVVHRQMEWTPEN